MEYKWFIGIDVSKATLDFCVMFRNEKLFHQQIENTPKDIKKFISFLDKNVTEFSITETVFCMEHTGIYNFHILNILNEKNAVIWLESAIHIIKSLGVQRGKNDMIDSFRIAKYAYKNRDDVRAWEPERNILKQLKSITTLRNRLINCKKQLSNIFKNENHIDKQEIKIIKQNCNATLKAIDKDIKKNDEKIQEIIKNDIRLNELFNIITSVDGVGKVTATQIIITTNEFKSINDAKKFACYAGVAPFEYSSGSSIRGKTRVSNMANKKMKQILHMAALSSICMKGELQEYYFRKVEEGKSKMSVINAIRNKIILRIFACVNKNKKYEKNYIYAAV